MIRRKSSLLVIISFFFSLSLTIGQTVKGTILSKEANSPLVGAVITLDGTTMEAVTNARGIFRIYDVSPGSYTLKLAVDDKEYVLNQIIVDSEPLDLGVIEVEHNPETNSKLEIGTITLDDADLDGADNAGANISSLLTASRDPFVNAAAFNLSVGRFRQRGYGNQDQHMYLNGMPVNDLDDGRVGWATWGGLNDILRSQESFNNLDASPFAFGGMLGSRNIDLRASSQRPQTKFVQTFSNRSYQHRSMITHSTGEQKVGRQWIHAWNIL